MITPDLRHHGTTIWFTVLINTGITIRRMKLTGWSICETPGIFRSGWAKQAKIPIHGSPIWLLCLNKMTLAGRGGRLKKQALIMYCRFLKVWVTTIWWISGKTELRLWRPIRLMLLWCNGLTITKLKIAKLNAMSSMPWFASHFLTKLFHSEFIIRVKPSTPWITIWAEAPLLTAMPIQQITD